MPDLGTVIREYIGAAEADTRGQSSAALRSMQRALANVDRVAAGVDHAELAAMDDRARARLAFRIVDEGGLPPARLVTIEGALRALAAYTPRRADPSPPPPVMPPPRAAGETSTPTFAMASLGGKASLWLERLIVIAFVLTAIGLALALL